MNRDRPSITAFRVALSRAAHQMFDEPKVFEDPIAPRIIGEHSAQAIRANPQRSARTSSRFLRAFVTARSRIAEDLVAEAVARGVRRYLVLGAGLDTFAYRNPYPPERLRVLEIDHPATQAWKRQLLADAAIAVPESLTFVPVDFETQRLDVRLREAGLEDDEPVFCSWLGVTMYLTHAAFTETLAYLAARPAGSGVVFDYATPYESHSLPTRLFLKYRARQLAAIGEPWQNFFEPAQLAAEVEAAGFSYVQEISPDDMNARFFAQRRDGLRVGGVGHMLSARR